MKSRNKNVKFVPLFTVKVVLNVKCAPKILVIIARNYNVKNVVKTFAKPVSRFAKYKTAKGKYVRKDLVQKNVKNVNFKFVNCINADNAEIFTVLTVNKINYKLVASV